MKESVLEQKLVIQQVHGPDRQSSHLHPTCIWHDIKIDAFVLSPLTDFIDILLSKDVTASAID